MGQYRIGTYLRLKPSARPSATLHVDATNSCVRVDLRYANGGPPRKHEDQMVFHFDGILQNASQETCFNSCALKVVDDVLCGYNGTILAYGQSGSGKTYTMSGDPKVSLHKGIIPRAIHHIFSEKASNPDSETSIHVSYLEVHNEVIYDLLSSERKDSSRIVTLMEDNCGLEMKGLSQSHCENVEDAMKHYLHGERQRCINSKSMNKTCYRSHCMFTIYVERNIKRSGSLDRVAAKLNLVDLAGCERMKCADTITPCGKEICSVNKALTFLEQAVSELCKGQGHVSFRHSRLTMLLKDALGGNSRTMLIVCALQEHNYIDEMISTLRFSQRVKDLKTSATINKVVDSIEIERKKYQRKISELRKELAFQDTLNGGNEAAYDEMLEERRDDLKNKVEAFLSEKEPVDCIPIKSLTQVKEIFHLFKEVQVQLQAQMEKLCKENNTFAVQHNQTNGIDGVSELEPQGLCEDVGSVKLKPGIARQNITENEEKMSYGRGYKKRNTAFLEFKHTLPDGMEHAHFIKCRQAEIKEKKLFMRKAYVRMKDCTREIHEINCLLVGDAPEMALCEESEADGTKVTEQEELQERLKNAKEDYGKCLQELTLLKDEIQSLRKEILECQESLLSRFFKWYRESQ